MVLVAQIGTVRCDLVRRNVAAWFLTLGKANFCAFALSRSPSSGAEGGKSYVGEPGKSMKAIELAVPRRGDNGCG